MIHPDVGDVLNQMGHDVRIAQNVGQDRSSDEEIMEFAQKEARILITLDEHFGNWVILPLNRHCGVVRLKVHPTTSPKILEVLIPFIEKVTDSRIRNHLVIVSKRGERWILTSEG
ncbi:MAG: DUF5615 family PIN-like protein [Candidatus Omnitrophica bacterium]|nr:DUF5615 family PIN-like protein [Candidatus Omnitrophota bacterium]